MSQDVKEKSDGWRGEKKNVVYASLCGQVFGIWKAEKILKR